MKKEELSLLLKKEISAETGIALHEIDDSATFHDLGLDSVSCVFVLDKIEKKLKIELNPMYFWDFPTVGEFAEHIVTLKKYE